MPPLTPRGAAPLHRTVTPVHILGEHAQLQAKGGAAAAPIHTLVVATKATDLQGAVRALRPRLAHTSTLVLLQNGILAAYQVRWPHME
ncbi:ketopantoate reductase PanE/ApbA, partial [Haematococcus lacustris]